jgi:hypothetical protein
MTQTVIVVRYQDDPIGLGIKNQIVDEEIFIDQNTGEKLVRVLVDGELSTYDEQQLNNHEDVVSYTKHDEIVTVTHIRLAKTIDELENLVKKAAEHYGYEMNNGKTYEEEAQDITDTYPEMSEILSAAETKWFELENRLETITLRELGNRHGGGVYYNDRGNGSGGPGYTGEDDLDDTPVTIVTEDEDPEAWELARDAAEALDLDTPTIVAVGDFDSSLSNPYQRIYAV